MVSVGEAGMRPVRLRELAQMMIELRWTHLFTSLTPVHVLSVIKKEDPSITKFFLRSDNAGCYHKTELLLSLKAIGERHGVEFKRYDFSDPQSGKDVCGLRIAWMKTHMRRWV